MDNIIEKIYERQIQEDSIVKEAKDMEENEKKEWALYEALEKALPEKELELFNEYMDLVGDNHDEEEERAFQSGFIAGALLMVEVFTRKKV